MAAFPASRTGLASAEPLVLRAAVSAYLGRYRGQTRLHTESDLRVFLRWCADHDLDPLAAVRVDIERYLRWLQDVRRYQPSTVSRRLSVVVGFYRVCVIDQILPTLRASRTVTAALTRRLRPSAHSAGGVTHAGARPPAVRSADHHRAVVGQPQRLRPDRSSAWSAYGSSKPAARASPTWARSTATGSCGCAAR